MQQRPSTKRRSIYNEINRSLPLIISNLHSICIDKYEENTKTLISIAFFFNRSYAYIVWFI